MVIVSTQTCLQSQCDAAAATMFKSGAFDRSHANNNRRLHFMYLRQVMESHVMEAVHDPVFAWVQKLHQDQTSLLAKQLRCMRNHTLDAFGIKPVFQCAKGYASAINELAHLNRCRTPLEKLQCLRSVTELVQTAVEDHLSSSNIDIGAHQIPRPPLHTVCSLPPSPHVINNEQVM